MGFGEAVRGEGDDLVPQAVGHLADDAVGLPQPAEEPRPQRLHPLDGTFGAHRAAQRVGLRPGEPGGVDGDLHQLFLEQRDAQGLAQRFLQHRVVVDDLFLPVAPADVGVDAAALDGAGADQGHLHDEVEELPRPQPGQRGQLRARLDLEHPDGVGAGEHVVDGLLRHVNFPQPHLPAAMLGHQVDAVVDRLEHAQPQQIELDQPGGGAVVLVPLHHRPVLHPRPFHGHDVGDGPVADDHAAGVDAQMPRLAAQPLRQFGDLLRRFGGLVHPRVDDARRVPQCPGRVAQRATAPIRDDVGHLRRIVPPIAPVDVLDDLLAPPRFDVEVDVRRPVALRRQEPLEQQPRGYGVDVGDPQRETHHRIRRRSAPLRQDFLAPAELADVVDDEEVPRKAQFIDDGQLAFQLFPRTLDDVGCSPSPEFRPFGRAFIQPCHRPVAAQRALAGDVGQPRGFVVALRHVPHGQPRRDEVQREGAFRRHLRRGVQHAGQVAEHRRQLLPRTQPRAPGRRQLRLVVVERLPLRQGMLRPRHPRVRRGRRRRRGARHLPQPVFGGSGGEVALVVGGRRREVRMMVHRHVLRAERRDQLTEVRQPRDVGQHLPLPAGGRRQLRQPRIPGHPLLAAGHQRIVDGVAEPPVALRPARQHRQRGLRQRQFRADDRAQPGLRRGLREPGDAVEPVAVGDAQHAQTQPHRLVHEVRRVRGAVQEGIAGPAVQVDPVADSRPGSGNPVRCRRLLPDDARRRIRPRVPLSSMAVDAISRGQRPHGLPGQDPFDPGPAQRTITAPGAVSGASRRTPPHAHDSHDRPDPGSVRMHVRTLPPKHALHATRDRRKALARKQSGARHGKLPLIALLSDPHGVLR